MYEFGYTFSDMMNMTPFQLTFLMEGLVYYFEEQGKSVRRARKR